MKSYRDRVDLLNNAFSCFKHKLILYPVAVRSRRWQGHHSDVEIGSDYRNVTVSKQDLAGTYALRLQEFRAACESSHHDPGVIIDILSHSGASTLLSSTTGSRTNVSTPSINVHSAGSAGPDDRDAPRSHMRVPSRAARSAQEETVTPMHFPRDPPDSIPPHTTPSPSQLRPTQSNMSGYYGEFANEQPDNLMAMCDALMGQSFTNLDRVIPFDGTAFSFMDVQDFEYTAYNTT